MINPTGDGCIKAGVQGSLLFAATADRIFTNLRYVNGGSVSTVGDLTTVTATQNITDATPLYLAGLGAPNSAYPGDTFAAFYKFGKRNDIPVMWDANLANPSTTPVAAKQHFTVGDWKKCTMNWSIYKDPPSNTASNHYYRIVVDATGCPPNILFELWFNYSTGKYVNTRVLGTPAGGLPNVFQVNEDGTAHWERDIDPNIWTKSNTAANGNTHGAAGKGTIPDITANPDASFYMAAFIHNDQQSNGNAGWCMGDSTGAVCGIPNYIGTSVGVGNATSANTLQAGNPAYSTAGDGALTPPYVRPYLYLPGKVGFESVSAFGGGSVVGVSTNTYPLANLQPY
jgi:hypothetical protein